MALLFSCFFVLLALGLPIAFVIFTSSAIYLTVTDLSPLILLVQKAVAGVDSFSLMAIPLFIVMGYLMEAAGLSQRLIDWTEMFFGRVTGGLGMIAIVASAIFAALTGSGPATVAAIGTIMFPRMVQKGYPRGDAAGLVSAAAALGPVIPPSTVMIIYATTMSVPISELFVAGVTPGVLIAVLFCVINYYYAKKVWRLPKETKRYTFKESMRLTLKALPTLLLPVIILGGIYGGIFTPTEAGAIGAMYSVVLGIVYRSLTWKKLVDVFKKSLEASAMAGFLIGMSSIFCWIIAAAKIPAQIVDTLLPVLNGNTFFFWVAFLLILLVAGCVLEALSAVVILAPILIPVGLAMGLEPMHLAVVFCVTMTIGIVTPPFGGVLFTTVSITKTPFGEVAKGEIPYIFAMILVCVLIAIFPDLALWLPNLIRRSCYARRIAPWCI